MNYIKKGSYNQKNSKIILQLRRVAGCVLIMSKITTIIRAINDYFAAC